MNPRAPRAQASGRFGRCAWYPIRPPAARRPARARRHPSHQMVAL